MSTIPKTKATLKIEESLEKQSTMNRIFGVFECTIGWYGRQRVDYITLDYKHIFRCYEIKVSKSDFYSKSAHTFVGHLNYYVMPKELYNEVKKDIPSHIGVKYLDERGNIQCSKQAKKQSLKIETKVLYSSMIRCLCRDRDKLRKDCDK